jgi:hypothetical protein
MLLCKMHVIEAISLTSTDGIDSSEKSLGKCYPAMNTILFLIQFLHSFKLLVSFLSGRQSF